VKGVPTFLLYRGGAIDPTHSKVRIPSEHDCTRGPSDREIGWASTFPGRAESGAPARAPGTLGGLDMVGPDEQPQLRGRERRALRRLAHGLRPLVQVGEQGLTESVIAAVDVALRDHELVKLEIAREREQRALLADAAAARTQSALAGLIGRMAILYRPAQDPGKRRIDVSGGGGA
jgi:RNA-binding protein